MDDSTEQAANGVLSFEDARDLARKVSETKSSSPKINIYKNSQPALRCERKLLYVMMCLLIEIHKEVTNDRLVSLVCSDPESFKNLDRDHLYLEAAAMLMALRSHISAKGTPFTAGALEKLGEFPARIQQKAMIMAIHDLTEENS